MSSIASDVVGESLNTLLSLLGGAEFLSGFIAGTSMLVVLIVVRVISDRPRKGWGLSFATAALAVLLFRFDVSMSVLLYFGGICLASWQLERVEPEGRERWARLQRYLAWALVVVAVIWFTTSLISGPLWLVIASPLALLSIALSLRVFQGTLLEPLLGPLFAITVFGVWATVPETNIVRSLVGVALSMSLATLPPTKSRLSGAGGFALAGLLIWLSADGGITRPGSIIGAWGSIGMVALIPLAGLQHHVQRVGWIVGGHLVFVFLTSRVIGLWESALLASLATGALFTGAAVALRFASPGRREGSTFVKATENDRE